MSVVDLGALEPARLAAESLFIGGEWQAGEHEPLGVVDPSTEQELVAVPSASAAQVDAALQAARDAQRGWERTGPSTKQKVLDQMAQVMRDNVDALAEVLVQESGKTLATCEFEVEATAALFETNAEWALRIEGDILPSDNEREVIHLLRTPYGVVSAICAWNFPLALLARKVAPALVTGNTIVLKPSEMTPLSSILAVRLIQESVDLAPGVLNLVTGGTSVGQGLVRSPMTDLVTFTGHRDTGKRIMADAAPNLTRIALEHGGKAPAIVLADADLEATIPALVGARFAAGGQMCGCAERILVERPILDEFTERYAAAVKALRVGDPRTDVDFGPLANAEQYQKVSDAVDTARTAGASVVTGGGRPDGAAFEKGFWYEPTVLSGVDPGMAIARDETFGPVIPVLPVDSIEQALTVANDTRYGLAGYLFTQSYATAMSVARDLDVGELFINRTVGEALHAHHGGHKESGYGGEDGKYGVLKYTQIRAVYHNW